MSSVVFGNWVSIMHVNEARIARVYFITSTFSRTRDWEYVVIVNLESITVGKNLLGG